MMLRKFFGLIAATLFVATLPASVSAQDVSLPVWSELPAGQWTRIRPGGDTICSNGDPYSFFVRPADQPSEDLLIHFQGGGACWFGENCDLASEPTYDPSVGAGDNPRRSPAGIFDFENSSNPFQNYNAVMVPYCTGDVHIGNVDRTYTVNEGEDDAHEVTIHHRGFVNAMTVLDWTFTNIENPDTVFVTGCSAGSIPSPLYTQFVAEAYPNAHIEQLGDAAGGYRNQELASVVFEAWGTQGILPENYAEIPIDELNFEAFYRQSTTLLPDITFTQYNAANDLVQQMFLILGGMSDVNLHELLQANFADIEAGDSDNFFSFTAGGDGHCVTVTPEFYTVAVNGMPFVEWVRALAADEPVETVSCTDCDTLETIETTAGE